ncbi:hypothetical protein TNCV_5077801 [Trichonephila clavipes]|uniref:Uncharacterized protein n=1 Tax=Trichonephila clavipes TaxID=2585209 RepID=A0A8X6VBD8_TRICX|nr:hypothetical protein TNCV_5077801 [Trichonephila clavipes]
MHRLAQKTTPCRKIANPASISESVLTMGVTNRFRNMILKVKLKAERQICCEVSLARLYNHITDFRKWACLHHDKYSHGQCNAVWSSKG